PAGYEAYAAGTLIMYGGASYITQGNGIMLLAQQLVETTVKTGSATGQRYLVPAGCESYSAGTVITYGPSNYVIQGDGTMLLTQRTTEASASPEAIVSQPYQGPANQPRGLFRNIFRRTNRR